MSTNTTLIIFAHPFPRRSRVNRRLLAAVRDLPHVSVHDLYERYPDFAIDVDYEQQALIAHERIVWQHPLYWYSIPPLLKEWIDTVLERGFAFGAGGDKLQGKKLLQVVSTGGKENDYQVNAYHGQPIEAYLTPWRQTAAFCGMQYQTPFLVRDAGRISVAEIEGRALAYRNLLDETPTTMEGL